MPIDQKSDRPLDPSACEPNPNRRTAASEPTLSNPPISPELALVDPALRRTAPLGGRERQEADVIDNGNAYPNGNGAGHGVAELVAPPAAALEEAPAVEASPETLLFRAGLLSPDQLGELVQERVSSGRSVEEIVIERGWLDAGTVAAALAQNAAAPPVPEPALEPHPDPFAIPVTELTVEPVVIEPVVIEPVAVAAAFELAPQQLEAELQPESPFEQHQPLAAPVVELPVVELPVEPVAHEPVVLEPVVLQPVVAEPVELEQSADVPAAAQDAAVEFRVSIRFLGNECVEIASHTDAVEAKSAAQALVAQLSQQGGDWPFVGGRFVRPEAVLSVDVDAVVR